MLDLLEAHGEVTANRGRKTWSRRQLLAAARDATALLAFMPDRVDEELLSCCPRLRIVAGALKGWDNVDLRACSSRGVYVTIVPDLLTAPTADLAVALLLAITRRLLPGDRHVREGRFHGWRPIFLGDGIEGSTVGVVGLGAVGRAICRRLAGFGPRVIATDPHAESDDLRVGRCSLEELLTGSDHVILAAPLTNETFHLIDRARLATMRRGSYLVNVGRGSVVDELAVAEALEGGQLSGYAADVFEFEDHSRRRRPKGVTRELLALGDRTVFTPHLGSAVAEVRRCVARAAAESIVDLIEGRRPRNAINAPRGPERPAARRRGESRSPTSPRQSR